MTAERRAARVERFGDPDVVALRTERLGPVRRGRVRVRVTHASLGATDLLARTGGYVLQPRAGFVPGYDIAGVVEHQPHGAPTFGLSVGQRVAGCLPRMGAHATHVDVAPSLLVPVPDALPSDIAAAMPLDLLTARRALDRLALPTGGTVLIQGVTGPVGALAAQLAAADGFRVIGTASTRSRRVADERGITVVDHRADDWSRQVLEHAPEGVDGTIDHTGSPLVRDVTAARGRIVRIGFAGRPGQERRDAVVGGPVTLARAAARPPERLVSIPWFVTVRRRVARRQLLEHLELVAFGRLRPPRIRVVPFTFISDAHRAAERPVPGEKVVLRMPDGL